MMKPEQTKVPNTRMEDDKHNKAVRLEPKYCRYLTAAETICAGGNNIRPELRISSFIENVRYCKQI